MKPGSCAFPCYGIVTVVLDPANGYIVEPDENGCVEGVMAIRQPWPGIARMCLGDHSHYLTVYLKPYSAVLLLILIHIHPPPHLFPKLISQLVKEGLKRLEAGKAAL